MHMHNPAHPGEVIRESCLKPLGMTVTAAAEGVGVTRKALSDLLNGHSGVSPEMAIRLEKAGWSTAEDAGCTQSVASAKAGGQDQGPQSFRTSSCIVSGFPEATRAFVRGHAQSRGP